MKRQSQNNKRTIEGVIIINSAKVLYRLKVNNISFILHHNSNRVFQEIGNHFKIQTIKKFFTSINKCIYPCSSLGHEPKIFSLWLSCNVIYLKYLQRSSTRLHKIIKKKLTKSSKSKTKKKNHRLSI